MRPKNYQALVSVLFAMVALPLALRFNSVLIGFLGVAAVYSALGFGVSAFGLCYVVGFDSDSALERCLLSSLCLLVGLFWVHVGDPGLVVYFRPLLPALSTLGSVTYFLALLIKTHSSAAYWPMQALMVLSLNTAFALGSVYQVEAIRNTAAVFTALYIMEKTCDMVLRTMPSLPLAIFIISVFLWRVSLYLHQHPILVFSIFTGM